MKKAKNLISILVISAILSGCAKNTTASLETKPVAAATEELSFEERLSKLKWEMSLEEVAETIGTEADSKETETTALGETQTLLTYENQVYEGYDSYLIVCVIDDKGLNGINYHIPTDNPEELYVVIGKKLSADGGIYDPTGETFSFWHFDSDNYTIMLANFGTEVQLSYYPLFAEDERGEKCGIEYEYADTDSAK